MARIPIIGFFVSKSYEQDDELASNLFYERREVNKCNGCKHSNYPISSMLTLCKLKGETVRLNQLACASFEHR